MLRNKTILIISPEAWDSIFVSKHHYAKELAKRGNDVFFLNPPKELLNTHIVIEKLSENLFKIDYKTPIRGLRFLPFFLRNLIERNFLKRLQKLIGKKIDVVWNFENSRFFDFRFADKNILKIYHQVDLNQQFNPKTAATTADIVFAVNTPIQRRLAPYNEVFIIPHGYAEEENKSHVPNIREAKGISFNPNRIKASYVGNLDSFYLDKKSFVRIIYENIDVDFFIIGPYSPENSLFREFKNAQHVHFIGRVAHDEIKPLLAESDVLLLLYQSDKFPDYLATSHKVLEYLASGKPIISSFMQDYVQHKDLLIMAETNEQIPDLFRAVVSNLSRFSTEELRQKRVKFALDNSYSRQLDRITRKLEEKNLLN